MAIVALSDNALEVFRRRYIRKGEDGEPIESKEETFWRVAYSIAREEEKWGGKIEKIAAEFYHLLANKRFLPNSPNFYRRRHTPWSAGCLFCASHQR